MQYSKEEAAQRIQQLKDVPVTRTKMTLDALRNSGEAGVTVRQLSKILNSINPASYIMQLRRAGYTIISQHTSTQDKGTGVPRRQCFYHLIEVEDIVGEAA
ncbi:MAG: winged helix domain-containing protein [Thiolinea sp.]